MNLKERTIVSLRNAILRGEYRPGERLTEAVLCRQFTVSRTPVREALNRLEKEGFLRITPGAGAKVIDLSMKETLDIYDILIVLEGAASRFACSQLGQEQIDKLEEYNLLFQKAFEDGNTDLLFDLNARFHWLITESTGNQYLIEMRTNFRRLVDRIARIFPHVPGQCEHTLAEHRRVIDAFKARNSALAEFVMREHLENAKKNLSIHLRDRREDAAIPDHPR